MSLLDTLKNEVTEIEHRTNLTTKDKVSRITHICCATCAGVAIQPIPFADILLLTPIQAYMGSRIAAIRGVPVSEADIAQTLKELGGVIGVGFAAQQTAIGLYKIGLPGLGGFMTIPLVYGLSYAIMRLVDAWYEAKARKVTLTAAELKAIWKSARAEGEVHGKHHAKDQRR